MRFAWYLRGALCMCLIAVSLASSSSQALAEPCNLAATATLYGARDVATLAGQGTSDCSPDEVSLIGGRPPQPYFTYEVACSTDRQAAVQGLCSTTPCPDFGTFFA